MREELEINGAVHDLYSVYGCGHGDGWYTVLRGLCMEITAAYEREGLPANIIVDQIKEKCGSPGVLRKDMGWVQTLCNECYTSIKKTEHNELEGGKKDAAEVFDGHDS